MEKCKLKRGRCNCDKGWDWNLVKWWMKTSKCPPKKHIYLSRKKSESSYEVGECKWMEKMFYMLMKSLDGSTAMGSDDILKQVLRAVLWHY